MKNEIIKYLKETDGYVSGQELCERLGVSRTAVWKVIRQLEADGYEIEAVRNRGYRLKSSADILNEAEIRAVLTSRWLGQNLKFFEETDSTNNAIRRMAENGAPEGTLAVAEIQTAGKGRRGRSWNSPKGSGIWHSFLLRPEFAPDRASMLTLLAAMAVLRSIKEVTGLDGMIKWPNDIVVNGKKVCGILTEMSTEEDTIRYVVVGIGINANTPDFPEEIRPTATSLMLELKTPVCRAKLINGIMCAFEEYYTVFCETKDMSRLKALYNQNLVNAGRSVKVLAFAGDYIGISHGINDEGELIVELPDGTIREVNSGEVSVRGIYGYV